MTHPADDLLGVLSERQRDEVIAAWAAVEYGREPVDEVGFAALGDPALRETLRDALRRTGRDLVRINRRQWTSGYADTARKELVARGWGALPTTWSASRPTTPPTGNGSRLSPRNCMSLATTSRCATVCAVPRRRSPRSTATTSSSATVGGH